VASCSTCGATLARGARYCAHCGRPTDDDETHPLAVPTDETGDVPIHVTRVEPRLYGVTPANAALAVAAAAVTLAVVLLTIGPWPIGLILLGVGVLLLLLFLEAARRTPRGTVSRSTAEALDTFRARAGVAAGALATRGRAAGHIVSMRRELRQMWALRNRLLFELGEAVYRGDDQGSRTARERIDELDRLAAQREAQMHDLVRTTQERIDRRRLEVQPTIVAQTPQAPDAPVPAPGEGNPPEPARIPEPYPPPDEGSPPQPAVIPEPGPAVIPEPGPQGRDVRRTTEP
jgi:hypothetical protein